MAEDAGVRSHEVWQAVKQQHPPRHAKYLVRRDSWRFVATPCYGMHAPWWVPASCNTLGYKEDEPIHMQDADEWVPLDSVEAVLACRAAAIRPAPEEQVPDEQKREEYIRRLREQTEAARERLRNAERLTAEDYAFTVGAPVNDLQAQLTAVRAECVRLQQAAAGSLHLLNIELDEPQSSIDEGVRRLALDLNAEHERAEALEAECVRLREQVDRLVHDRQHEPPSLELHATRVALTALRARLQQQVEYWRKIGGPRNDPTSGIAWKTRQNTFDRCADELEKALADPPVRAFVVSLTCCGRDAGSVEFPTWEQADAFREAYTSGEGVHPQGYSAPEHAPGHKRSGVITVREAVRGDGRARQG